MHARWQAWVTPGLLVALGALLVVTAWQCDDAFITWRTVHGFWNGHGLRWNPDERVQAYTHPLWMALGLVAQGLFGETYFSMLVVSAVLAVATVAVLFKPLGLSERALVAVAVIASMAFADYSVSGLENPLLGFLLVLALEPGRSFKRNALLASAIALTRLDAVLLIAPVLAWDFFRERNIKALALGALPFVAWELFSLAYYGFWVPNTAFAKLNVALPRTELLYQGLLYVEDALVRDPLTLGLTWACLLWVARRGSPRARAGIVGVVAYQLYVVWIGGDFMAGRFFTAPFVCALALAVTTLGTPRHSKPAAAVLAVYALAILGPRWVKGAHFGEGLGWNDIVEPSGIADERAYYYPTTGMLAVLAHREPGQPVPAYPGALEGAAFAKSTIPCSIEGEVGYFGYFAGDKTVIDGWALADPLLARLPFRPPRDGWRVGHYPRRVPKGYVDTRCSKRNTLADPELAAVYERLQVVVSGPLFSSERWREIWRFNTGHYDNVLRRPDYL